MSADVTEKSPGAAPPSPPQPAAPWVRLQCAAGPEGPITCTGATPVVLIGSRRDCHLPITHPDVSKVHCALINTGRGVLVRDLVSRCGTFINDQPARSAPLTAGGVLRLGPVTVGFELIADPQADRDAADRPRHATPQMVSIGGRAFRLADQALVVGRRNTADIVVDTPDTSLAHAIIFALEGQPAIQDLESRSGTQVDGERIELARLANGGEIEIGGERLGVSWEETGDPADAVGASDAAPGNAGTAAAEDVERQRPMAHDTPPPGPAPAKAADGAPPLPTTLDELEQVIAAVHSRLAAARGRLDERSRELEQRAAQAQREQAGCEARRSELLQAEAALAARQAQSSQAEHDLARERSALDERARRASEEQAELQRQRKELETGSAEVEAARHALETERAALGQQQCDLAEARAAFEREQRELNAARERWRQTEQELQARATELDARSAQVVQQQAAVQASQSELTTAQAAHAASLACLQESETHLARREARLSATEAELSERQSSVAKREQELQAREDAITAHEARNADLDGRIRDFKSALIRAGELFSTAAPISSGAQWAEAAKPVPAPPSEAEGAAISAAERPPQRAASTSACSAERTDARPSEPSELPAPIVDQPIFSGGAMPPTDWPPKLRERFRLLRRMSRKSDAELARQVWAERERVLASPGMQGEEAKRKRRFWGN